MSDEFDDFGPSKEGVPDGGGCFVAVVVAAVLLLIFLFR